MKFPPSGQRWHRIGWNALAGGGARVASALCGLGQAAVAVQHLGASAYGLLCTVVAFATVVNFAELGLGSVHQTALADAFGRDDSEKLRLRLATGLQLHAWLGALWLPPLLLVVWRLDWARWLQLDAATAAHAPAGMLLGAVAICIGLPLTVAARLAFALQLGWLHSGWTALGNAATLAGFCWAAQAGHGFGSFALLATLSPLAVNLILFLHLWRRLGWEAGVLRRFDRGEARGLMQGATVYAAPQVAGALLTAALPALLSRAGGPAAVAAYNLVQRLFGLVVQAHAVVAAPFWTAYTEAAARGDRRWIRQAFGLLLLATLGLFLPLLAAGAWEIGPLLRLWISDAVKTPPRIFVLWVAVWCAAQMMGLVFQNLLLGLNRLRGLALAATSGSIAGAAGMFLLGRTHGATGVVAGLAAGYWIFGLIGMGALCVRALRAPPPP